MFRYPSEGRHRFWITNQPSLAWAWTWTRKFKLRRCWWRLTIICAGCRQDCCRLGPVRAALQAAPVGAAIKLMPSDLSLSFEFCRLPSTWWHFKDPNGGPKLLRLRLRQATIRHCWQPKVNPTTCLLLPGTLTGCAPTAHMNISFQTHVIRDAASVSEISIFSSARTDRKGNKNPHGARICILRWWWLGEHVACSCA